MSPDQLIESSEVESLQSVILDLNQRLKTQEEGYKRLYGQIDEFRHKYEKTDVENKILREQVKLLTLKIYGKSSEKYYADGQYNQPSLFEDDIDQEEKDSDDKAETVLIPEHERKKRGRPVLPPDLPRKEIIHDIPEEEKIDSLGRKMKLIDKITSEKLCITPAEVWVEVHVRYKYASVTKGINDEDGEIKIAPVPVQLLPKTIATPSLVSHILTAKFTDSLPFYRQEKQFLRMGITISRGSMCNWTLKLWDSCRILKKLLFNELGSYKKIHIDETYTQVLCENDRSASDKSFIFVVRGGPPDKPTIYFHYSPTRNSGVVRELLKGFSGIVQSDGHVIYTFLDFVEGIIHCGCWSHARRYFKKVIDVLGTEAKEGQASKMLGLIRKLFAIERKADNLNMSSDERLELRQKESKPIVDKIKGLVDETHGKTNPKSLLGKGTTYMTNQWHRLLKFLENGLIDIDNNRVENDIRPYCVGRRNWLFSYHEEGVNASAFFYSLIETAKANGYEPFSYLNYFFENLPHAVTEEDYKMLLPQYIDPACVKPLPVIKR